MKILIITLVFLVDHALSVYYYNVKTDSNHGKLPENTRYDNFATSQFQALDEAISRLAPWGIEEWVHPYDPKNLTHKLTSENNQFHLVAVDGKSYTVKVHSFQYNGLFRSKKVDHSVYIGNERNGLLDRIKIQSRVHYGDVNVEANVTVSDFANRPVVEGLVTLNLTDAKLDRTLGLTVACSDNNKLTGVLPLVFQVTSWRSSTKTDKTEVHDLPAETVASANGPERRVLANLESVMFSSIHRWLSELAQEQVNEILQKFSRDQVAVFLGQK